jgi:hypothetical protein
MYNPLRYVDPTGWLAGGGGGHNGQLPTVTIGGTTSFVLPEVVVIADNPSLSNTTPIDEVWYTPNMNGGGSTPQWSNVNNGQSNGSGGAGGGNHGGSPNNTTPTPNPNVNVEIGSKLLIPANIYTTIVAKSYYNELTRTWQDKLGVMRDFDFYGNQYTGGKNSFGKLMSTRYTNAGRILGSLGVAASINQCINATTIDGQFEYGLDSFIGFAGVVAPELFGLPSTVWFLGGKQVTYWYTQTTIIPMIEQGINPGLMEHQPFK